VANYTPHQYLRFGGAYGPEEWSVGLRLQVTAINLDVLTETVAEILTGQVPTPTTRDETISAYLAIKIAPLVSAFWGTVKVKSVGTELGYVSVNHIGRDGKYTSDQSFRYEYTTKVPGTGPGVGGFCGPDVAVAVSLLTGLKRGYAARGRIYLPLNGLDLQRGTDASFGALADGDRTLILGATKQLLEDINDLGGLADGVEPAVCVFSPGTGKNQSPDVPGGYRRVTTIRVGAQPDTQRRRLNKVPDLWAGDTRFQADISA
jgi:hypothetical protein